MWTHKLGHLVIKNSPPPLNISFRSKKWIIRRNWCLVCLLWLSLEVGFFLSSNSATSSDEAVQSAGSNLLATVRVAVLVTRNCGKKLLKWGHLSRPAFGRSINFSFAFGESDGFKNDSLSHKIPKWIQPTIKRSLQP